MRHLQENKAIIRKLDNLSGTSLAEGKEHHKSPALSDLDIAVSLVYLSLVLNFPYVQMACFVSQATSVTCIQVCIFGAHVIYHVRVCIVSQYKPLYVTIAFK